MSDWKHAAIDQETELARAAARLRKKLAAAAAAGGGIPGVPGAAGALDEAIHISIDLTSIATHVLVAGVSGMKIAVYELMVWNVAEQDLQLWGGSDTLTGPLSSFPAQFGIFLPNVGEPHFTLSPGASFALQTSAADQVSGFALYRMLED